MSTSGATIGGLNFNNSSSGAPGGPSRVPISLAPVADAGNSCTSCCCCDVLIHWGVGGYSTRLLYLFSFSVLVDTVHFCFL